MVLDISLSLSSKDFYFCKIIQSPSTMENTSNYKYDVFISYSRKDYVDETTKETISDNPICAIKEAFDKNGITYWFDEEGIYSGQAFVDIITEAIALSKSFVFISSKNSNHSKWTKCEIMEAYESDKTITPFKIDDTEYDKSVRFFLRPLDFISYFENKDNAIEELIRSVQKVKDKIAEEEKQKKEEAKRLGIKVKIKELIEDYQRLSAQQETIQSELFEQSRLLGLEVKTCPVCGKSSKIDNLYCDSCGWTFHPLFAVDEAFSLPNHKVLFSIFKTQWKSLGRLAEMSLENEQLKEQLKEFGEAKRKLIELTKENEQLKKTLEKISRECEQHIKTIKEKEAEVAVFREKCSKQVDTENYYKEREKLIDTQKRQIKELEQQISTLQIELSEQTVLYKQSEQKLKQLETDYQKSQEKKEELAHKLSSSDSLYDVILMSPGRQKLAVVKMTKELTDLGLKESKELVDSAPSRILTGIESTTAIRIIQIFKNIGATVEIQQSLNNPLKRIEDFVEHYSSSAPRLSQSKPNTLYDIILVSSGPQKLAVVKLVRDLTPLGLKESKELVDAAPSTILKRLYKTQAIEIADLLKECGAKVELCPSK